MDRYASLIKQRGAAEAAEILADLCRAKDAVIDTCQTMLRSVGGATIVTEGGSCERLDENSAVR